MRRKCEKVLALLISALLLTMFFPPSPTVAARAPVLAFAGSETKQVATVHPIDRNGDGEVDEYIYYDDDGEEIDRFVLVNEGIQAVSAFSAAEDEPLKHVPVDPVPANYGGNSGEISFAFYPTYGEWVYDPINDTEAELIAYLGTATEVTIPDTLGEYTVVDLGIDLFSREAPYMRDESFYNNNPHAKSITQVTIPETVQSVYYAFLNGTSVQSVSLPNSVVNVYGLSEGSKLSEINVSPANPRFTAVNGVLYNKDVTRIIAYPPEKTDTIFTLPSTLSQVYDTSFASCRNIEAFAVSGESTYFSTQDGVLYSKDGTTLIRYPMNKADETYFTPVGVTTIGSGAFHDTMNLKHIVLSEGVENIVYVNSRNVIETLSFPSTLVETDGWVSWSEVFCQMFNLVSVTVSPSNPVLCSEDGILFNKEKTVLYAYPMSKPETEYIMPDTLLTVPQDSFFNGRFLQKLTIPASLTDFNEIDHYNHSWEEIVVADGNSNYAAIDGVLYTKDMKVLVSYPNGKQITEFVIPDSVEYINTINSRTIQTMILPPNLKIMSSPSLYMRNGTSRILGKNDYARRWANYFGINFTRIDVTAEEITDALNAAATLIAGLGSATHDSLSGLNLETLTNLIENYESLSAEEKAKLASAQITELEMIRNRVGELNHADGNVSISGATWNIRVDAKRQNPSDPAYNSVQPLLDEDLAISVLYDIRLTRNGVNYNLPSGQTMTVTITGSFTGQTIETVRIFHLKSDYTIEYIVPMSITDTEITFKTQSFSLFGVVVGEFENPVFLGDVNDDGELDIGDVNLLYMCIRGKATLEGNALLAADVNGDGDIDIGDVNMLYMFIRGKIPSIG